MIRRIAYPRAAVIGNPSDGYFGKTIAFPFSNFKVEAWLEERAGIMLSSDQDQPFDSFQAFHEDYAAHGAGSEHPLQRATLKRFIDHCRSENIVLDEKGFAMGFESTIPREVGLAGSSAIITAMLRTLLDYYEVSIPLERQANLILEVETKEMGIGAGLQDRVVQAYERPVYMDFGKELMESRGYGEYQALSVDRFQNIYIAYRAEANESSGILHNDLGARYRAGDERVHHVMTELAQLTDDFLEEMNRGDKIDRLGQLMDRNFDLRQSICAISQNNLEMIQIARALGASAKFTGSGGAIIGIYQDEAMYQKVESAFTEKDIRIFRPNIVSKDD